jgi:hypothetical protein
MEFIQDLSGLTTDRYIIVGEVNGDYERLVNMLYQQRFTYKDTLIMTGNFINLETANSPINSQQLDCILFIKNLANTYSVKGANEFDFLRRLPEVGTPDWLKINPKSNEILKFIEELPLIIKVSDYIYVTNAGMQPNLPLSQQNPEVFYSIGDYDKDSRFYQFDNPDKKSWYEFDLEDKGVPFKVCFGGEAKQGIVFPAGYCLGRSNDKICALILRKGQAQPIFIEA